MVGRIGADPGRPRAADTVGSEVVQPLVPLTSSPLASVVISVPRAGKPAACAAVHIYPSEPMSEALPPARARYGPCLVRRARVVGAAGPRRAASRSGRRRRVEVCERPVLRAFRTGVAWAFKSFTG